MKVRRRPPREDGVIDRVRQDGDSRGVGKLPGRSLQVLSLAPQDVHGCFRFMFRYLV